MNCGYISSNFCFRENKTNIFPAYKIIEKGGKKIAFIGVSTPYSLTRTNLNTIVDNNGQSVYYFLTDEKNQELYERIQGYIDKLRNEEKADYVIILSHLGFVMDISEENSSINLLQNLKNVSALIDGHSHSIYSFTTQDVIIAQAGTKLSHIGVLTIHVDGSISHENIDEVPYDSNFSSEILNYTAGKVYYTDKEMHYFINEKHYSLSDKFLKIIGKTDFPLNIFKLDTIIKNSKKALCRSCENILCNLVTDALRYYGDADITIINAGSIRVNISKGNFTVQDIINASPFQIKLLLKK